MEKGFYTWTWEDVTLELLRAVSQGMSDLTMMSMGGKQYLKLPKSWAMNDIQAGESSDTLQLSVAWDNNALPLFYHLLTSFWDKLVIPYQQLENPQ